MKQKRKIKSQSQSTQPYIYLKWIINTITPFPYKHRRNFYVDIFFIEHVSETAWTF